MREFAEMASFDAYIDLLDVLDEAKTASEAAEASGIPQATVYRYLRRLDDLDLVEEVGVNHSGQTLAEQVRGRPETLWRRQVDSIDIELDGEIPPQSLSTRRSQSPVSGISGGSQS